MYRMYTTQELTPREATRFGILFDKRVGTERQTITSGQNRVIMCLEVTPEELKVCREIEEEINEKYFYVPD